MTAFLERACREARERVAEAARAVPLAALQAAQVPAPPSFAAALAGGAVIAEVKRASPSRGHLADVADPAALAHAYAAGGAAAVSVLTEPAYFRGSLDDLAAVAANVDVPVLRKDFVVDAYQVWEARRAGAAAVLLIVAALDDAALADLLAACDAAGLDALVEVHDAGEAARACAAQATREPGRAAVVGVNARDLHTLEVDPGRFAACVLELPAGAITVAESGLRGPADVTAAIAAGADAVLVGEHVVTAADPEGAVRSLVRAAAVPAAAAPGPGVDE